MAAADELRAAWQASAEAAQAIANTTAPDACAGPEQWMILITCRDEKPRRKYWAGSTERG
jgi:hypothetical protein